jgi:hypothetical protein
MKLAAQNVLESSEFRKQEVASLVQTLKVQHRIFKRCPDPSEQAVNVYCVKRCEAITLKRMTVQRRIADISKHPETQLTEIFNKCVYFALTVDQSTDIT